MPEVSYPNSVLKHDIEPFLIFKLTATLKYTKHAVRTFSSPFNPKMEYHL